MLVVQDAAISLQATPKNLGIVISGRARNRNLATLHELGRNVADRGEGELGMTVTLEKSPG